MQRTLIVFLLVPFLFLIPLLKRKKDGKEVPFSGVDSPPNIGGDTLDNHITTSSVWDSIRYFEAFEFDSPDAQGSGEFMNPDFLIMLDECRHRDGKPWSINSGYRTTKHNGKIGGVIRSSHTKFLAADISCTSLSDLKRKVQIARDVGFKRIGQYHTKRGNWFIHLDIDETKPQNEWAYENWGGGDGKRVDLFLPK